MGNSVKPESRAPQGPEEVYGADDGDALVLLEREEVPVAGDDEVGVSGKRGGENVVVVGVVGDGVGKGAKTDDLGRRMDDGFDVFLYFFLPRAQLLAARVGELIIRDVPK